MTTVHFNRTNLVSDPGYDLSFDEVVDRFVASDDYAQWRIHGGRLARCLTVWMATELGGSNLTLDGIDELVDLILATSR